ncbi:hypothetical protein [Halobaculum gomorrense]|uniref:Uncharacterized protein n=1 Tax=Halobaculum gomorrense TaxID=43928 RepID=A0A1M5S3T6_9EURY|nr:hypothetical protein [Halobaculum gomorrense]SHH32948.1 hypothetical protein SAMN05443636_2322 [Halobaculum gomorrense]
MNSIEYIYDELNSTGISESGWLINEPKSESDRIVLCGMSSDSAFQIRIIAQDSGGIVVEGSEGSYGHYGFVDGPSLVQEHTDSPEEAFRTAMSVMSEIESERPPYSLQQTIKMLSDCGASLITVYPISDSILLGTIHTSKPQNELLQFSQELDVVEICGNAIDADWSVTNDLSPALNAIVCYNPTSIEAGPGRITAKVGAEKVTQMYTGNQSVSPVDM